MRKRAAGKKKTEKSVQQREHSSRSYSYPFSAIVGQEEMKLALTLNAIDPLIGGVLIMGHRGTGKSTAVRALGQLLPAITAVADCAYSCDPTEPGNLCVDCRAKVDKGIELTITRKTVPVVELPLGATEDRVCGTIDIERELTQGKKAFDPGLLARANRGFLYIDEVNLLEDHLVDLLLDVAVTGWNKVERENISVEHPAKFVLIGSGNPEEGELRPQLLDRFGLHTEVRTENYLESRIAIVERRDAYDRDSRDFCESYAKKEDKIRGEIIQARSNLRGVVVDKSVLTKIAQLCADLSIDGHRGELTIVRAARALAALAGRSKVTENDVRNVSAMALRHRMRRDALDETASAEEIEQAVESVFPQAPAETKPGDGPPDDDGQGQKPSPQRGRSKERPVQPPAPGKHQTTARGNPNLDEAPSFPAADDRSVRLKLDEALQTTGRGRYSQSHSRRSKVVQTNPTNSGGKYTRAVAYRTSRSRIAFDATLRAIAISKAGNGAVKSSNVLRYKVLKQKQGTLYIFLIDTSGSMAVNRIARAKTAILKVLRKSYLNRDSVSIISFHGTSATVELPPSRSILRARRVLDNLQMGGSTPLATGLVCAIYLIRQSADKFGDTTLLLFTDGRSNVPLKRKAYTIRAMRQHAIEREVHHLSLELRRTRARVVVIDTQRQFESSEDTRRLAKILRAQFVKIDPETKLD
jgi:magnesium chelatase subunit D